MKPRATLIVYGNFFISEMRKAGIDYIASDTIAAFINQINSLLYTTIEHKYLFAPHYDAYTQAYNEWKRANVEVVIKAEQPHYCNTCSATYTDENAGIEVAVSTRIAKEVYRKKNKTSKIILIADNIYEDNLKLALEQEVEVAIIGGNIDVPIELQNKGVIVLPIISSIMKELAKINKEAPPKIHHEEEYYKKYANYGPKKFENRNQPGYYSIDKLMASNQYKNMIKKP